MPWSEDGRAGGDGRGYLALGEGVFLKRLETPCAYNARTDDLYELSDDALGFLRRCDGTLTVAELTPGGPEEEEFLSFCLEEGVLEHLEGPARRDVRVGKNSTPSLRYLAVEVTGRCNLRCRHCYQGGGFGDAGGPGASDLDLGALEVVLEEFAEMGGLRLMITGGEPLLYPRFVEINRLLAGRPYRRVLMTNGTVIPAGGYASLNFDEVQFSIDGLEEGHDFLRGPGNYAHSMRALEEALAVGLEVSVATVLHARNLDQVAGLGLLLKEKGVFSWTLEFPVPEGRMRDEPEMMPDLAAAVPLMDLEWGSGGARRCRGLCLRDASGKRPAVGVPGQVRLLLRRHRGQRRRRAAPGLGGPAQGALEGVCAGCDLLQECGGGCRYRALLLEGEGGPDPVMCARHGRRHDPPRHGVLYGILGIILKSTESRYRQVGSALGGVEMTIKKISRKTGGTCKCNKSCG